MEVKVETTRATRGGPNGLTSTPDTGKTIRGILVKTWPTSPRLSNKFLALNPSLRRNLFSDFLEIVTYKRAVWRVAFPFGGAAVSTPVPPRAVGL